MPLALASTVKHCFTSRRCLSFLNTALLALILLLGMLVLYGWHTENTRLIQVLPVFVPMQYNTALGFLLVGLGLGFFSGRRVRLAQLCGALLSLLSGLTLAQYLFGVNIGLDELFMDHAIVVQTSHPGRMAPNTALCFSLAGFLMLSAATRKKPRVVRACHWSMGAIILSLGSIAAIGYWAGVSTAYGWGRLTRMALHTSVGFMMTGTSILVLAWLREGATQDDRRWIISLLLLILGASVALFNYNVQVQSRHQANTIILRQQAKVFAADATQDMNDWASALAHMAWQLGTAANRDALIKRATRTYGETPSLKQISLIALNADGDRDHALTVLAGPPVPHTRLPSAQLETFRAHLKASAFPLWAMVDGKELLIGLPAAAPQSTPQLLLGHFDLEVAMQRWIAQSGQFNGIVSLLFDHASLPSYASGHGEVLSYLYQPLRFRNVELMLTVTPTTDLLQAQQSLTWVGLLMGLCMALGLAGTVYFYLGKRLMQRQLQTIQQSTTTGLIASDSAGKILYVNPAAANMFGYTRSEMVGRAIETLFPAAIARWYSDWGRAAQVGDVGQHVGGTDLRGLDKQGNEFPVDIRISLMAGESGLQILSSLTDMSLFKKLEDKLRASNDALKKANQELENFSAIASHDLQEPLRTIRSYCDFLVDDIDNQRFDRVVKDVNYITDATERQTQLVQSLLDYSRLQKTTLTLSQVDMNDCLNAVIMELESLVTQTDAEILVSNKLPNVWGDYQLLVRVFQNLIHNAIKYQAPNSTPRIAISASQSPYGRQYRRLCVQDNGIGIPKKHRETIFQPFRRLHGVSSNYKGSGIGLATVRDIIIRHAGFICVEAGPSGGACFCVDLTLSADVIRNISLNLDEVTHGRVVTTL